MQNKKNKFVTPIQRAKEVKNFKLKQFLKYLTVKEFLILTSK